MRQLARQKENTKLLTILYITFQFRNVQLEFHIILLNRDQIFFNNSFNFFYVRLLKNHAKRCILKQESIKTDYGYKGQEKQQKIGMDSVKDMLMYGSTYYSDT